MRVGQEKKTYFDPESTTYADKNSAARNLQLTLTRTLVT